MVSSTQFANQAAKQLWREAPSLPRTEIYVQHTFVNVVENHDVDEGGLRPRTGSDFTGLRALKARGLEHGLSGQDFGTLAAASKDAYDSMDSTPKNALDEQASTSTSNDAFGNCPGGEDGGQGTGGAEKRQSYNDQRYGGQCYGGQFYDGYNGQCYDGQFFGAWNQFAYEDQAWCYPVYAWKGVSTGVASPPCQRTSGDDEPDTLSSVPSGEVHVPQWFYGRQWPFNCAPTTLTLGNLPSALSQEEVIAVLNSMGFRGKYDLVYMPKCFATGKNLGHATVNLLRHADGLALAARIHGFQTWSVGDGETSCTAEWSLPMQGWTEHVEAYRNHPVMHESVPESFRPMVFENGRRGIFPQPTEFVPKPRLGRD